MNFLPLSLHNIMSDLFMKIDRYNRVRSVAQLFLSELMAVHQTTPDSTPYVAATGPGLLTIVSTVFMEKCGVIEIHLLLVKIHVLSQ